MKFLEKKFAIMIKIQLITPNFTKEMLGLKKIERKSKIYSLRNRSFKNE